MRLLVTFLFILSLCSCKSLIRSKDSYALSYEVMSLCDDIQSVDSCRLKELNSECGVDQKCVQTQKLGEQDISESKAEIWLCSCEKLVF